MEHRKRFTWNIASVSRGTSQAFHVEHRKRSTWNTNGTQARTAREASARRRRREGAARTGEGGGVRLRFFLLLVRACVLGYGRRRSASLLPPPCSGLRARLWAAAFGFASSSSLFGLACSAVGGDVRLRFCPLPCSACWPLSASLLALPCSGGGFYRGRFCFALKPPLLKTRSPSLRSGGQSLAF